MAVSLKAFKVFVDETTENCYASYKVNRNFIYLITKSRRKLVRNMAKAVRMADIAQRLGISTVSVSKGLAGKEGVSAEMRAKIVATAEEMGYQPPARTNAHPGGESIGILVADRFFNENAFYSNLYRSVLKAAAEQDISVLMEIVLPQAEKSCNMPTFLVNRKVDGLIFMGEISRRYLATAVQTGVPFMLLDFYDDGLSAGCGVRDKIGRAACRGRGEILGGGGSFKKKKTRGLRTV